LGVFDKTRRMWGYWGGYRENGTAPRVGKNPEIRALRDAGTQEQPVTANTPADNSGREGELGAIRSCPV
jgi:hypothetical protein